MFTYRFPFITFEDDPGGGGDPVTPPAPVVDPPAADTLTVPKADYDAQAAALAEYRRKAKKAEDDAKKQAEDQAKANGEHQKLAEQYQAERDQAKADLANERAGNRVKDIASRLKFHDGADALAQLPADVDREDEAAIESALKRIAEAKPYLIDNGTPTRTGAPAGGGDPSSVEVMTPEEARKLARENPAEFNKKMDAGEIPASALTK